MHPRYLQILQRMYGLLISDLHLSTTNVLDSLLHDNILTAEQLDDIKSKRTNRERNETFMVHLRRCPPEHEPFDRLLQALDQNHGHLARALRDQNEDRDSLLIPLQTEVCDRCLVVRYVDPVEMRAAFYQCNVIDEEELEELLKTDVPESKLTDRLLRHVAKRYDSESFDFMRDFMAGVVSSRSPNLGKQLEKIKSWDSLLRCYCVHGGIKCEETDTESVDNRALAPAKAETYSDFSSIVKQAVASEFINLIAQGHRDDHSGQPGNQRIISITIAHELLHRNDIPTADSPLYPSRRETRTSSSSLLDLYTDTIMTEIHRATGSREDAETLVTEAIDLTRSFCFNSLMGSMYEKHALEVAHNTDPASGRPQTPSLELLEGAAEFMHLAYENYSRSANAGVSANQVQYSEFEFWPLLYMVFIRLGTCVTGEFLHPGGVRHEHWVEIEEATRALYRKFSRNLTPFMKVHMLLMEADCYIRRAQNNEKKGGVTDEPFLYHDAKEAASKAYDIVVVESLNPRLMQYAQRRVGHAHILQSRTRNEVFWSGSWSNFFLHRLHLEEQSDLAIREPDYSSTFEAEGHDLQETEEYITHELENLSLFDDTYTSETCVTEGCDVFHDHTLVADVLQNSDHELLSTFEAEGRDSQETEEYITHALEHLSALDDTYTSETNVTERCDVFHDHTLVADVLQNSDDELLSGERKEDSLDICISPRKLKDYIQFDSSKDSSHISHVSRTADVNSSQESTSTLSITTQSREGLVCTLTTSSENSETITSIRALIDQDSSDRSCEMGTVGLRDEANASDDDSQSVNQVAEADSRLGFHIDHVVLEIERRPSSFTNAYLEHLEDRMSQSASQTIEPEESFLAIENESSEKQQVCQESVIESSAACDTNITEMSTQNAGDTRETSTGC